ncbi:uncharacterized protein LOC104884262 [Beta vulgaris subsp. vulgaris]|uniref:uncharacterized protein LOC104884262 n=1 Tax=Beta vulgaris subsp. vulgaris TaxID=3555 RepID=UPI0005402F52|nr:uncharacterized protein LOC104884262 [Beta vulgaris subsp. vulgaris]
MSTKDMIKALTKNVTAMQSNLVQFQEETKSSIYNLETQVGQMSSVMNRLEAQNSGKLPSQTEVNPKKNVSVVILRSGKELVDHAPGKGNVVEEKTRVEDEEVEVLTPSKEVEKVVSTSSHQEIKSFPDYKPTPPFPDALKDNSKLDFSKDNYETFSQCNVNIPLLQLIKTAPLYAKWLKEMCSIKRKSSVKGKLTVKVSEHVSAVFQKRMPKKCDDPGMFTIPITLGDTKIDRAMLDLGASINVLPYSLYESSSIPRGVVEDVLVVVDKLTFPADFYVIDMEHDKHSTPILLGRPFLKTAKTKIDCDTSSLTIQFDGQIIEFNMYDAMIYPNIEDYSLCSIDVFEPCVQGLFDVLRDDHLQSVLDFSLIDDSLEFYLPNNVLEVVVELNELSKLPLNSSNYKPIPLTVPSTRSVPSVVQAPDVELKTLPEHVKYVFLGEKETFPIIISNKWNLEQDSELMEVLNEHLMAIGWSIADIRGISPSTCMHRILLEDEAKPVRQPQWRYDPPMMEVVKKEFLEVFMDDFTIQGDSFDQCLYHLSLVLKRRIESHLVLSSEKCHFMVEQGIVLGHVVSSRGIEVDKAKIDVIQSLPYPISVCEVRYFLGHAGFYRRFIKDFSKVVDSLKEKLTSALVIQAPIWSLPFEIMCDASDYAVGAVLSQKSGRVSHVIHYASMTLNRAQRNYSTTKKEMIAVVFAIEKFRSYFLETKVIVYTDHAAINT